MVEERLDTDLEPEVIEVLKLIKEGENFLLSGGAGSGKTYSLVNVIRQVILENPIDKIACMTYTNAAVKEIEDRVNHKNLNVSTIHDFLWDNIKHFQKELKAAIISLANDNEVSKIKIDDVDPIPLDFFKDLPEEGVQYKEYTRLKKGIISHDELLIIAEYLFKKYPKLSTIVKDKYPFIFIDEYQDTNKEVIEIFLRYFKQSERQNIIGFFGDAMQSIYDDGVGDLDEYKGDEENNIKEVQKSQNRRNPQLIIELANKLRTDGIIQKPSDDNNAPNMSDGEVKQGRILFLHSNESDINKVKEYLEENYDWDFTDSKETKELNLTHNLIADNAGFRTLMDIYDKDRILKFRDRIKKYIKDKNIETDFSDKTFGEVIAALQEGKSGRELRAVSPTNSMNDFIENNLQLFEYAQSLNFSDFSRVYIHTDQLLDDKKQDEDDENRKGSKRDNLIKHLFKIQNIISLYQKKRYNEFLKATDFRLQMTSIQKKRELKGYIESLINVGDKTIEEVISDANEKGICVFDDKIKDFIKKNEYLYNRVKKVEFKEFQSLYEYLEGRTPFSTQHKTKGTEFNNVLVLLDNGGWSKYNFEYMFLNNGTESVRKRTQKLFYVCCTRAKENLAIFYHNPNEEILSSAVEWFGKDNMIKL